MKRIEFCILTVREFKSDIPDTHTIYIHLTIISNQCWILVILMQEIIPKEKGN